MDCLTPRFARQTKGGLRRAEAGVRATGCAEHTLVLDALTRTHVPMGRIHGIPIGLNLSWFPVYAIVAWSLATGFLPQAVPGVSPFWAWTAANVGAAAFFLSILAHELGHALVAQWCGIGVNSITLFILGGVSRISSEPRTAREELVIAAAGPAVSVGLSIGMWFVVLFAEPGPLATAVGLYLVLVNGALALFNMIPALPLDGGRVLRAVLWGITGQSANATKWAAWGGRACGASLIMMGGACLFAGAVVPAMWLVLIGVFIERAAKGSVESVEVKVLVPALQGATLSLDSIPEGVLLMNERRFRDLEARVISWRARLDALPRPADLAAERTEGGFAEGPDERRYFDDRMRMYEILNELDRSVRAEQPDEELDARFQQLEGLYVEWEPVQLADDPDMPEAGEEATLAGRPERFAPSPEEVLSREPGSSAEI